ncbi:hypothetical protein [uncultured Lacinutrix sp.]|uniref:hypothetical protein n=1 Tax=uncultured Lacinutrix sp. TaxID=574032 RepID=UPI002605A535|nr:hypothetical protein [uncultured Lacinutrix sp.]
MDYKKLFEQIIIDIKTNPYLELTEYKFNEGLNSKELEKLITELHESSSFYKKIKMESVFNFYSQFNGLTIKWKLSSKLDALSYKKLPELFTDLELPFKRDIEIGCINILPFEDVFIYEQDYFDKSETGDFFTHFGDYVYEGNSFGNMLYLFDLYSETDCMSFLPDEDNQEPKVVYLSDYYIVWDNTKVSFFDSYIIFLAATRGLINSREQIFDFYRGDKEKPIIFKTIPYNTEIEPTIFQKDKIAFANKVYKN